MSKLDIFLNREILLLLPTRGAMWSFLSSSPSFPLQYYSTIKMREAWTKEFKDVMPFLTILHCNFVHPLCLAAISFYPTPGFSVKRSLRISYIHSYYKILKNKYIFVIVTNIYHSVLTKKKMSERKYTKILIIVFRWGLFIISLPFIFLYYPNAL